MGSTVSAMLGWAGRVGPGGGVQEPFGGGRCPRAPRRRGRSVVERIRQRLVEVEVRSGLVDFEVWDGVGLGFTLKNSSSVGPLLQVLHGLTDSHSDMQDLISSSRGHARSYSSLPEGSRCTGQSGTRSHPASASLTLSTSAAAGKL